MMCSKGFVKGMAVGMMAGAAIGMAVVPKRKKCGAAGKALKTAGDFIDGLTESLFK